MTTKNENWVQNAIESWLLMLNPKKLMFKKLVFVVKQCLNVISLNDACEYMTHRELKITDENIALFMRKADEYYLIRTEIFNELVLSECNT